MSKKIKTIVVDTVNAIQNNQYMKMLDRKKMVTRDKWRDFGVELYAFMVEGLQSLGFEVVLILGYEGSGKSYGIKYLEPGTNIWYNCDRKNPTFKYIEWENEKFSSRKVYGTKSKPTQLMVIPETYGNIITHIRSLGPTAFAEDRVAFVIGHVDDFKTTDGTMRQRLKTLGKMATKMNIEGSVENLYYTNIEAEGDNVKYMLDTKNNGFNNARCLEDAFDSRYIPNNFHLVYQALTNY